MIFPVLFVKNITIHTAWRNITVTEITDQILSPHKGGIKSACFNALARNWKEDTSIQISQRQRQTGSLKYFIILH